MIKYLAIYDNGMNKITFTFEILNKITFNALLCTIKDLIDIQVSDKQIINHLRLYQINQIPINYIHAICTNPIDKSNLIDMDCIIQVDNINAYAPIDN